ncbi:hypothetical protein GGR52DRAFT_239906 [Hypoxylon sp. FL1284]|nr:hypothetical protein GGR52DRAFT_239906 [Hypoxylon sp. FL1284]
MALGRWTWSTSRRQSNTTSSSGNRTNGTTTPTDEARYPSKSQSRLLRTFTGGFKPQKSKKQAGRDEYAHLNRPFTQQNLEHQKILNAFEWNFGKRKSSHGGQSNISSISPSASRTTSVDHGHTETHTRFSNSLGHDPPREDPREESDRL